MMRAYIYTGGVINPDRITDHPKGEDLVIAADSGWNNAKFNNIGSFRRYSRN